MSDEGVTLRDINWRETFPFTHLFRAFRVAVHPSKLILALLAIGCLWCGGLIADSLWLRSHTVAPGEGPGEAVTSSLAEQPRMSDADRQRLLRENPDAFRSVFRTFWDYQVTQANNVLMLNWSAGRDREVAASFDRLTPTNAGATFARLAEARTRASHGGPIESVWNFIAVGPLWLWSFHPLFAAIYTAWFLLIWSVFGGAICRIAAVHIARDEKISVRHALTFSTGKILSFIFAPVIPVFIVLGIGIMISIAATILLHIPYVGPIVAGVFFCLALLGGFVITLVILGTIGGFNLMYPTVAVEGSDSFDAISRSFSYVFARPWRMLWYTVVAVVYGAICYLFVRFFVWIMLAATWFFMSWLLGPQHPAPDNTHPADVWPRIWPAPIDPLASLPYTPDYASLKSTEQIAAGLIVWWVYLVLGLIGAFAISFYFSSNTIIYYLMRREVDATEMDDVYVEDTEDELEEPVTPTLPAGAGPAGDTAVVTETTTVRVYETPGPTTDPAGGAIRPPAPPPEPPPTG